MGATHSSIPDGKTLLSELSDAALMGATGRSSANDALAWIAEEHPLASNVDLHELARLVAETKGPLATRALERLARELTASRLDSAAVLHQAELLPDASVFGRALDVLAQASGGSLAQMTASALRTAQQHDPHVMETLEALIGVTHKELRERVDGLPVDGNRAWTNVALNKAFSYIDSLVTGTLQPPLPSGTFLPAPVELVSQIAGADAAGGWSRLEELRTGGVPYELMLAQRVVGSAWGQHRNRTSQAPMASVALDVREQLMAEGLDVVLSDKYGGDARQADLKALVGGDQHVNLVARTSAPARTPVAVVTFSLAKDGGSARKTLSAKLQMTPPTVPVFVVVLGGGFSQRNETVELVRHFDGAVYTEQSLPHLASAIAALSSST